MDLTRNDFGSHISSKMNQSLEDLFNHVLEMGGLVEKQLDNSVLAIQKNDVALAKETILLDKAINSAEKQIDKMCARVLARQQPAAADLRLIITAIRVALDLERMGDEIVKIARMVIHLNEKYQTVCDNKRSVGVLIEISSRSKQMLKTSLDAFARVTSEGTVAVITEEEEIDLIYKEAMTDLVAQMKTSGDDIECLLDIFIALRACERISDHARNMAEMIVYLVKGHDVRDLDMDALNRLLAE